MNPSKRVFYVIYAKDDHSQRILDAIRFLADPSEKNRAHVTLRGPYPKKRPLPDASKRVEGTDIQITGVDAFFRQGQNTVFFQVKAPDLRKSWHKPNYPDYKPHLTIYDGPSRKFAENLRTRLDRLKPRFHFPASSIEPLITQKGQGKLDLRTAYDEDLVAQVTGKRVTVEDVHTIDEEERLNLIEGLCSELVEPAFS